MEVVIIGSGNVATVMGRILQQKGHRIRQVWSREQAHADKLAGELNAQGITDLLALAPDADLYLLAVTDSALAATAARIGRKEGLVVHTAGSVSKDILKNVSNRYGVLWPMKMIRRSMTAITPVTIVMDGNTATVRTELEQWAHEFSLQVITADDAMRSKMHLLAAVTSNFPNHLYHLAADYCAAEQIDFRAFYPIIEETSRQVQQAHPRDVQAGPALRGDETTLKQHEALLKEHPALHAIYTMMTESIRRSFEQVH